MISRVPCIGVEGKTISNEVYLGLELIPEVLYKIDKIYWNKIWRTINFVVGSTYFISSSSEEVVRTILEDPPNSFLVFLKPYDLKPYE